MGRIRSARFDDPGQTRVFPHGLGQIARVGPVTLGRARLEPGWRWSVDMKPTVGTTSCQIHHLQILLGGRLGIQLDDGEAAEFAAGDVFEIPAGHDAWVIGEEPVNILDVFGNVASYGLPTATERVLATLLMTDIVDSTATAARLGDVRWMQALAGHNRVTRAELARFGGREVTTTGDGFLATFGSAVSALRSALAIREGTRELGIDVRVGVHTGEIEILPDGIGGLEVHAVARLMALAGPSEIVVSAATQGLVRGSGLRFDDLGPHDMKGFDLPMEVFRLAG